MLRGMLYFLGMMALLIALFVFVVMAGMAIFGIAIVRSYAFGIFASAYILLGVAAALGVAIWIATRPRAPD